MDFISKAQQEVRSMDAEALQQERDLVAALGPILGSHGFYEFVKTIERDRDGFLEIASSDFDSVLNPIPMKALAAYQYAQSILDRIADYRKRFEGKE